MDTTGTPSARALERGLAVIELLVRSHRGLSISEISRMLCMPKSTAHVLVTTLERLAYVTKTPGKRAYKPGLKVSALAAPWPGTVILPSLARSRLEWLVEATSLTAHLAGMSNSQVIYIQKVEGPGPNRFDSFVGKRANLHCTAVGKVLLAYSPEETLQKYLAKDTFARHTERTITSAAALLREILLVRRRGYAIDDEEEELNVRCVAIPVFTPGGDVAVALGVTGTVQQIEPERVAHLVEMMKKAAAGVFVQERPLPPDAEQSTTASVARA